jgi:hypothetical protein
VAYGDEVSYANVYDNRQSSLHNLLFDTQFCKLLRYGLEESCIILLMALLPNIRDLKLWSAPYHPHSLRWQTTHGFKNLKRFTVSALWDEQGNESLLANPATAWSYSRTLIHPFTWLFNVKVRSFSANNHVFHFGELH